MRPRPFDCIIFLSGVQVADTGWKINTVQVAKEGQKMGESCLETPESPEMDCNPLRGPMRFQTAGSSKNCDPDLYKVLKFT